jgi:hypothetical protein
MFTFRKRYFFVAILLFIVELFIAIYMHDEFLRPYGGDFLVVIFLYCFLRSFINRPVLSVALAVLLLSYIIEVTQHFGLIYKLRWEHSLLAHLVLGSTFKWLDMLAYTLGTALVLVFEEFLINRPASEKIAVKVKA